MFILVFLFSYDFSAFKINKQLKASDHIFNLVPRVFSLFSMAETREKTLAHNTSRDQNLQRGWRFIQNGRYGEKSEKIWVRDMAKLKVNKMAGKAEVQFKKKREKKRHVLHVRILGIRQSVRGLVFAVQCFFFCYVEIMSNGFEGTRLPLVDSKLLK